MDKILEKLGIYDLVVLLLTGMVILFITIKIIPYFNCNCEMNIDDSFQFLIISYFVGMIFQELGSKLNCRKLLKCVFRQCNDLRISLSQKEKDFIVGSVSKELNINFSEDSILEVYNYCKDNYLKSRKTTIEIDRQQSIGGMARSLAIYFSIVFLIALIKFIINTSSTYFFVMIISLLFTYIFYNRYIRFFKMRYVHILRAFYYDNNKKKKYWN